MSTTPTSKGDTQLDKNEISMNSASGIGGNNRECWICKGVEPSSSDNNEVTVDSQEPEKRTWNTRPCGSNPLLEGICSCKGEMSVAHQDCIDSWAMGAHYRRELQDRRRRQATQHKRDIQRNKYKMYVNDASEGNAPPVGSGINSLMNISKNWWRMYRRAVSDDSNSLAVNDFSEWLEGHTFYEDMDRDSDIVSDAEEPGTLFMVCKDTDESVGSHRAYIADNDNDDSPIEYCTIGPMCPQLSAEDVPNGAGFSFFMNSANGGGVRHENPPAEQNRDDDVGAPDIQQGEALFGGDDGFFVGAGGRGFAPGIPEDVDDGVAEGIIEGAGFLGNLLIGDDEGRGADGGVNGTQSTNDKCPVCHTTYKIACFRRKHMRRDPSFSSEDSKNKFTTASSEDMKESEKNTKEVSAERKEGLQTGPLNDLWIIFTGFLLPISLPTITLATIITIMKLLLPWVYGMFFMYGHGPQQCFSLKVSAVVETLHDWQGVRGGYYLLEPESGHIGVTFEDLIFLQQQRNCAYNLNGSCQSVEYLYFSNTSLLSQLCEQHYSNHFSDSDGGLSMKIPVSALLSRNTSHLPIITSEKRDKPLSPLAYQFPPITTSHFFRLLELCQFQVQDGGGAAPVENGTIFEKWPSPSTVVSSIRTALAPYPVDNCRSIPGFPFSWQLFVHSFWYYFSTTGRDDNITSLTPSFSSNIPRKGRQSPSIIMQFLYAIERLNDEVYFFRPPPVGPVSGFFNSSKGVCRWTADIPVSPASVGAALDAVALDVLSYIGVFTSNVMSNRARENVQGSVEQVLTNQSTNKTSSIYFSPLSLLLSKIYDTIMWVILLTTPKFLIPDFVSISYSSVISRVRGMIWRRVWWVSIIRPWIIGMGSAIVFRYVLRAAKSFVFFLRHYFHRVRPRLCRRLKRQNSVCSHGNTCRKKEDLGAILPWLDFPEDTDGPRYIKRNINSHSAKSALKVYDTNENSSVGEGCIYERIGVTGGEKYATEEVSPVVMKLLASNKVKILFAFIYRELAKHEIHIFHTHERRRKEVTIESWSDGSICNDLPKETENTGTTGDVLPKKATVTFYCYRSLWARFKELFVTFFLRRLLVEVVCITCVWYPLIFTPELWCPMTIAVLVICITLWFCVPSTRVKSPRKRFVEPFYYIMRALNDQEEVLLACEDEIKEKEQDKRMSRAAIKLNSDAIQRQKAQINESKQINHETNTDSAQSAIIIIRDVTNENDSSIVVSRHRFSVFIWFLSYIGDVTNFSLFLPICGGFMLHLAISPLFLATPPILGFLKALMSIYWYWFISFAATVVHCVSSITQFASICLLGLGSVFIVPNYSESTTRDIFSNITTNATNTFFTLAYTPPLPFWMVPLENELHFNPSSPNTAIIPPTLNTTVEGLFNTNTSISMIDIVHIGVISVPNFFPDIWSIGLHWVIGSICLLVLVYVEGSVILPIFAPGVDLFFFRAIDLNMIDEVQIAGWRFVLCQVFDSNPFRILYETLRVSFFELSALFIFLRAPWMITHFFYTRFFVYIWATSQCLVGQLKRELYFMFDGIPLKCGNYFSYVEPSSRRKAGNYHIAEGNQLDSDYKSKEYSALYDGSNKPNWEDLFNSTFQTLEIPLVDSLVTGEGNVLSEAPTDLLSKCWGLQEPTNKIDAIPRTEFIKDVPISYSPFHQTLLERILAQLTLGKYHILNLSIASVTKRLVDVLVTEPLSNSKEILGALANKSLIEPLDMHYDFLSASVDLLSPIISESYTDNLSQDYSQRFIANYSNYSSKLHIPYAGMNREATSSRWRETSMIWDNLTIFNLWCFFLILIYIRCYSNFPIQRQSLLFLRPVSQLLGEIFGLSTLLFDVDRLALVDRWLYGTPLGLAAQNIQRDAGPNGVGPEERDGEDAIGNGGVWRMIFGARALHGIDDDHLAVPAASFEDMFIRRDHTFHDALPPMSRLRTFLVGFIIFIISTLVIWTPIAMCAALLFPLFMPNAANLQEGFSREYIMWTSAPRLTTDTSDDLISWLQCSLLLPFFIASPIKFFVVVKEIVWLVLASIIGVISIIMFYLFLVLSVVLRKFGSSRNRNRKEKEERERVDGTEEAQILQSGHTDRTDPNSEGDEESGDGNDKYLRAKDLTANPMEVPHTPSPVRSREIVTIVNELLRRWAWYVVDYYCGSQWHVVEQTS